MRRLGSLLETERGLRLAILTTDVMNGLAFAERVPVGMVHINDQTSTDEPIAPFVVGLFWEWIPHRRPAGEPGGVHRNAMDHG